MILVAGWEANIGGLGVGVAAVGACVGACVAAVYTCMDAADASVAAVDAWRSHRLRVCTTSELASDLHHI